MFDSTPSDIKDGLTSRLTLRCSLHDTAASASVIGKRDVTATSDNIADVSAVIIMRGGKDVASVSRSTGAEVLDGSTNLYVTGSVTGGSGEKAYLQVEVTNPSGNHSGEYTCEVNTVRHGHSVVFSSTQEVTVSTPTTADMVNYMRDNNNEIQDNKNEIQQLKAQINTKVLFTAVTNKFMSVAAGQTVVFDKVYANIGGDYNAGTGEFVCSTPGHYLFSFGALLNGAAKHSFLTMYHNSQTALSIFGNISGGYEMLSNSGILTLAKGDVVKIVAFDASKFYNNDRDVYSTFSGHLLATM